MRLYLSDQTAGGSGSMVSINFWAGSPTNGTFLGSTTPVFISNFFFGVTNFFFSAPVSVTPGTTYYLQPLVQSGDSARIGILPSSSYPSGSLFNQGTEFPGSVLWFQEGVVVPEPPVNLLVSLGLAALYFRQRKTN